MRETRSATELAEKMGVDVDVISNGDDAAEYLDHAGNQSVVTDGGVSE